MIVSEVKAGIAKKICNVGCGTGRYLKNLLADGFSRIQLVDSMVRWSNMRMEFCVWGCGKRGKNICRFMEGKGIRVFIDTNPKLQGTDYQNTPIVSFQTYLDQYGKCPVIISPQAGFEEIQQCLAQHGIPYLSLEKLPREIVDDGIKEVLRIADSRIDQKDTIYLYGLNLFSICLLDDYIEQHCSAKIIPEDEADVELIKMLNAHYPGCIASLSEVGDGILYLTSEKYDTGNIPANRLANLYEFMADVPEYYNPEIEKFHNIHKGRRCFLVGCGPSLRIEDLDKLAENHELCIGVNGIVRAFPSTVWRPDCYLCQYAYGFREWRDSLLSDCGVGQMLIADYCFRDNPQPEFIQFHLSLLDLWTHNLPAFSRDFSHGAYAGGSVMYTCIQLAAYMGCSEMYLYGVDHTYSIKNRNNHFAADYLENEKNDTDITTQVVSKESVNTELAFAYAKQVGKDLGFKIYNASRKTALNVFEQVNFDALFT